MVFYAWSNFELCVYTHQHLQCLQKLVLLGAFPGIDLLLCPRVHFVKRENKQDYFFILYLNSHFIKTSQMRCIHLHSNCKKQIRIQIYTP
jgi:hypothetical protein